jgi:hypothetical protein
MGAATPIRRRHNHDGEAGSYQPQPHDTSQLLRQK